MRIGVVGSGIAGLGAAHALAPRHDVTVLERSDRPGGHTRTFHVCDGDRSLALDTGFIVHNEPSYPRLSELFRELGVRTQPSDMSFSVSVPAEGFEYCPARPWAHPTRLASARFLRLMAEVARFTWRGRGYLESCDGAASLSDLVKEEGYGDDFRDRYLLPLTAAIWSSSTEQALEFPARYALGFFDRHALLGPRRHRWRTVVGGSSVYVERIVARLGCGLRLESAVTEIRRHADRVSVRTAGGRVEDFDAVVVATHADQALGLLSDPSPAERRVLGAFRSTDSETVLHTDERLLPRARAVRASWNYRLVADRTARAGPAVTYYLNRLQRLGVDEHYCVSLNQTASIRPERIIARISDRHPLHTFESVAAQPHLPSLNGVRRT